MDINESRQENRYTVLQRIDGALASVDLEIIDVGEHGVQAKHITPVKLGTTGKLWFHLPGTDTSVKLPAHVVWSKIATKAGPGGVRPYYTGIRLDDPEGAMLAAIERMIELSVVRPDKESIERKRKALEEKEKSKAYSGVKFMGAKEPRIPDDVILLVKQARYRLQNNPAESVKWLNRAKYSLDEAGVQIHHRDDVLAIWEYLERSIELNIIARVLTSK